MNKKLLSVLTSSILAGSLMVGCSSSDTTTDNNKTETIKERTDNNEFITEKERIAHLKGLEGDELVEAYKDILDDEEEKCYEANKWDFLEDAEYYQDGINIKIDRNYAGNETDAEEYITKQMEEAEKIHDDKLYDTFSFSWTNNTGNDIDLLEINYKAYDLNGQSLDIMPEYEDNISNGETRKIEINTLKKNIDRIEITSVDIRHRAVTGSNLHYGGCIPGKWYKLEAQPVVKEKTKENTEKEGEEDNSTTGNKTTNKNDNENISSKTTTTTSKPSNESSITKQTTETTEKVTHDCWRCGKKNVTNYDEHWLCDDCYLEKIAHEEEDYVEEEPVYDEEELYCKGCGKRMYDNNNGTYACDDCLNMSK